MAEKMDKLSHQNIKFIRHNKGDIPDFDKKMLNIRESKYNQQTGMEIPSWVLEYISALPVCQERLFRARQAIRSSCRSDRFKLRAEEKVKGVFFNMAANFS